jgi:hypothetical protein
MHRYADALAPLEHAVRVFDVQQVSPAKRAPAHFGLAQARWAIGPDRRSALLLAERARDEYGAAGESYKKEAARVEAWLARRH